MSKHNPLVSIIIPTYNRANLISETLNSIGAQTFVNWECIIIDDGSTDKTEELVRQNYLKDDRFQFHHRPTNLPKGANSCRNYGFRKSRGKYVKWLDSDDLLHKDYLIHTSQSLREQKRPDLIICNAVYFTDDPLQPKKIFNNMSTTENLLLDYLTSKIFVNTPVTLWRKEALKDYQFDETLSKAQELDFHFRILKEEKLKVNFIDEVLVFIRDHEDSITGEYIKGGAAYLFSELRVRRNIMKYLFDEKASRETKKKSFKFYLLALSKIYKFHSIKDIFKEICTLEQVIGMTQKHTKWKLVLLQYLLIFKLTGRDYRLRKHINSYPILESNNNQE